MDYWKKNGEDVLIYSAYEYDGGKRIPDSNIRALLEGEIHQYLLCRNTIGAPTILIKKDVFEAVGGFDDKLKVLEDWDFVIRVSRIGKIGYVEKALVEVDVTSNAKPVWCSEWPGLAEYVSALAYPSLLAYLSYKPFWTE